MHNTTFAGVAAIGTLAVVSPGPDFVLVARNSLVHSRKAGFHTTAGIVLGNIWWVCASITGISFVISKSPAVFAALKTAGAIYLIYLGIRALGTRKQSDAPNAGKFKSDGMPASTAFRMGLFTNLSNPKAALFFVSFFSAFITADTPVLTRYCYGMEIVFIASVWFSVLSALLSTAVLKSAFKRGAVLLERITGVVLLLLGIKLLFYKSA
jgi:RhtB (resistance to homoserine/threonine) family protein